MKTAISIPDDLFREADRLARRTNKSRSRVFRDALTEYVAKHTPEKVTSAMDDALDQIGDQETAFPAAAARRILERNEW